MLASRVERPQGDDDRRRKGEGLVEVMIGWQASFGLRTNAIATTRTSSSIRALVVVEMTMSSREWQCRSHPIKGEWSQRSLPFWCPNLNFEPQGLQGTKAWPAKEPHDYDDDYD